MPYVAPKLLEAAFNCPHCNAYANQKWFTTLHGRGPGRPTSADTRFLPDEFTGSFCTHCQQWAIWHEDALIYPFASDAPMPSDDTPADVADDFREARLVLPTSPRSAAALLRLALQKLCAHLGQPGKNINSDIEALIKNGLPPAIQQALDSVRVIGNEAVHPGELDLRDDRDTALALFSALNFIVEKMITDPKRMQELYAKLPESKRQGIQQRDKSWKQAKKEYEGREPLTTSDQSGDQ